MSAGDSSKTGPGLTVGAWLFPQPTDAGAYQTPAGLEVGDGTNSRVTVGAIAFDANGNPTDYGLKVVSSDGTTVIIDGTSDMFKIVATGTLSTSTGTAPTSIIASTTLATGLTYAPAYMLFADNSSAAYSVNYITYLASATSPTLEQAWSGDVSVVSTNQTKVQAVYGQSGTSSMLSYTFRYYVLEEVAF